MRWTAYKLRIPAHTRGAAGSRFSSRWNAPGKGTWTPVQGLGEFAASYAAPFKLRQLCNLGVISVLSEQRPGFVSVPPEAPGGCGVPGVTGMLTALC